MITEYGARGRSDDYPELWRDTRRATGSIDPRRRPVIDDRDRPAGVVFGGRPTEATIAPATLMSRTVDWGRKQIRPPLSLS